MANTSSNVRWTDPNQEVSYGGGNFGAIPIDWGLLPVLAARMGWTVPQVPDWAQRDNPSGANHDAIQAARDFLAGKGYTPKVGQQGNANVTGIFDSQGNLVDSASYTPNPMADLRGLITTIGLPALGGAALSGAFGSALPSTLSAADMGGDAGFSLLQASGAAPSIAAPELSSFAPVTMADMMAIAPTASELEAAAAAGAGGLAGAAAGAAAPGWTSGYDLPMGAAAGMTMSDLKDLAKTTLPIAAGIAAATDSGGNKAQTDITKTIDPRIADLLYGANGYLPSVQSWFNANKGGNPDMQQGASMLRNIYTDPNLQSGYQQLQNKGLTMLGGANPFLSAWAPAQQPTFDPRNFAMPSLAPGARTGLLGGK